MSEGASGASAGAAWTASADSIVASAMPDAGVASRLSLRASPACAAAYHPKASRLDTANGGTSRSRSRSCGGGQATTTSPRTSPMAVGVVELVQARSSGVAFSVHPVNGKSDRVVIEAFLAAADRHVSVFALLMWLGFRRDFVEYDKQPRVRGVSGWTLAKKLRLVVDVARDVWGS